MSLHFPYDIIYITLHIRLIKFSAFKFLNFRKNYTGYFLESRLHFRIHSGLMLLTGKKLNNYATKKHENNQRLDADVALNNSVIIAGPSVDDSIEIKS